MSGVVRACFRRQVSDGNYGSETVEISIEDAYDDRENAEELAEVMSQEVRRLVHAELARSPSSAVRRAIASPRPALSSASSTAAAATAPWMPPEYEDDGDEIPAPFSSGPS